MTETQEMQAYKALEKWANRLNKWEYSKQFKNNKNKRLKQFTPNFLSLILIENMRKLINKTITPNDAMAILSTSESRTETRLCMEAGF